MTFYYLALFAVQLGIVIWAVRVWTQRSLMSALAIGVMSAIMAYSIGLTAVGAWLGPGEPLLSLSRPRYFLGWMQTPLTLWLILALGAEVGLALFQRAWLVRLGWGLIGLYTLNTMFISLNAPDLQAVCDGDILRYYPLSSNSQPCDAEAIQTGASGLPSPGMIQLSGHVIIIAICALIAAHCVSVCALLAGLMMPVMAMLFGITDYYYIATCAAMTMQQLAFLTCTQLYS